MPTITHPRWGTRIPSTVAAAVATAVALALVTPSGALVGAGPAGAEPLDDADATVQALREDADRAAAQYFDTLGQAATLDLKIQRLETRLPALAARRRLLRHRAEARAVAAYRRAGTPLAALLDTDDALAAARRRELLARLNAGDAAVIADLVRTSNQLRARRRELHDARAAQDRALADLRERGRDIDAKLQAALARRTELEAQVAAATTTTVATTPTTVPPADPAAAAPTAPVPSTPPPGYRPTPGTHPHHDDPFLACTRARESGGNYAAANPAGPYLGAYQFLQATWNGGANHAGRLELVGVPPNTASPFDQDDVAWTIYQWRGKGPWGNLC